MVMIMTREVSVKAGSLDALLADWQQRDGLTDEEAAAKLGVSKQMVHQWRREISAPNRRKWELIAERVGCTIDDVALAIANGVKS
jgi:transcriptional regulator with XRE-family HTH domain